MNKNILFFLILVTGWPAVSYADINRNNPSAYGIGVLTCPYANFMIGSECFRNLSWLNEPIRLYDTPKDDAKVAGTILDPDEKLHGWQPFHFWETGGILKELDVVEVAYEEKAIVIYERKGQWLRTGKGWLKSDDIKLNGSSVFLSWDTVLGYQLHGKRLILDVIPRPLHYCHNTPSYHQHRDFSWHPQVNRQKHAGLNILSIGNRQIFLKRLIVDNMD